MKKKIVIISLIAVAFLAMTTFLISNRDYKKAPPTLYFNGNIITLNDASPSANAMLVKDGVIKHIGNRNEIDEGAMQDLHLIDLKGATVLPGFIDVHTHFALSMFLEKMHNLSGFQHETNQEVWNHFENITQQAEAGEWLLFKGLDPILVPDLNMPSIHYLDSIAPDNPVFIFSQNLHDYWANSAAFKQAGIHSNTPNPSEYSYYERDTNGNLTGHLVEQEAIKPFVDKMSQQALTASHLAKASEEVMRNYAKNGNTTIVSTGLSITDSKPLILLKHLSVDRPTLLGNLLNVIGQLPDRQPYPRHFIYIRHDTPDLLPTKIDTNNFYGIIGVKHWYDGSPYTGSMFIEKPYLTTPLTTNKLAIPPNSQGEALVTKENLKAFVKDHHEKGWQIAIHTQGDAAISNVIDVYDQLASELDFSRSRHRLEHCLLLPTSDLDRMKRLNLTPSFHINHLYYYGEALYTHILGEKRTNNLLPVRSAWQQSIVPTLHADQPMFESKPFRLIQTAIERKANSGRYIAENQSIELMEAIKALTINAAWQIHKEKQLGSLETGKYADFIILDQNPFELPTAQLENIKIQSTFINGNKVIQTP